MCVFRVLAGKGVRGSVGSRGSRRLTGRGSVGFALAPLDEVESMRVDVVSYFVNGQEECRLDV